MSQHNISTVAHLIAEPVRAVILITLTDNSARSAGALAEVAGVTAQTASSHLAKLLGGGLLKVESKGRHRYYRLAGPHVARAGEPRVRRRGHSGLAHDTEPFSTTTAFRSLLLRPSGGANRRRGHTTHD